MRWAIRLGFGAKSRDPVTDSCGALQVRFRHAVAHVPERGTLSFSHCPASTCDIEIDLDLDGFGVDRGFSCEPSTLDFGAVNPPDLATLRVFVDHVQIPPIEPSGRRYWTFDRTHDAVDFTPLASPEPGAEVRFEYVVRAQ